jgi:hypothetical protein
MHIKTLVIASATALTASTFSLVAKADTVDARCDIYPLGSDQVTEVVPCTFSQRQGAVGIQLQDGTRYDLRPVGDQPGNFVDQNGNAAYRQAGLGDRGLIFQTVDERIFVYWDTAGIDHSSGSSGSNNPTTYTTFVDPNHIVIQVSDDGFYFHDTLTKLPGLTTQAVTTMCALCLRLVVAGSLSSMNGLERPCTTTPLTLFSLVKTPAPCAIQL